jgi:hypothetical protein
VRLEGLGELKSFNNQIGNRTRDLPVTSIVPQLTTLPRAPNDDDVSQDITGGTRLESSQAVLQRVLNESVIGDGCEWRVPLRTARQAAAAQRRAKRWSDSKTNAKMQAVQERTGNSLRMRTRNQLLSF